MFGFTCSYLIDSLIYRWSLKRLNERKGCDFTNKLIDFDNRFKVIFIAQFIEIALILLLIQFFIVYSFRQNQQMDCQEFCIQNSHLY